MKGLFIHASLNENGPEDIVRSGYISSGGYKKPNPLRFQIPNVGHVPITYCSFYCEGYKGSYQRRGVIFEPQSDLIYASPVDNFEFLRCGKWIPGFQRFVFKSIEEMLAKYPTQKDFKEDFRRYFKSLKAEEIFPPAPFAPDSDMSKRADYSNNEDWINLVECNEIGFIAPLKVKIVDTFFSEEELHKKAKKFLG
jgi:hypothetical protein